MNTPLRFESKDPHFEQRVQVQRVMRPLLAMVLGGFLGGAFLSQAAQPAQPAQRPLLAPAPDSPIAVAGVTGSLALGELNQDGKPDLVVASKNGIRVLLGRGDGRFRIVPGGPLPHQATEMLLRDLNGDGRQDLALAHHDSYDVILLFGDGKGGFALAPASPLTMKKGQHPHTHGLLAGDLNGDSRLDIVSVNSTDNDVSVAFGDGKGRFEPAATSFPVGASPYPGALGDLDGDGDLDLIATTTERRESSSARALTVLIGDGHGGFRAAPVPLRTASPWFVAIADLNGDRKPDLVATHAERSELTVLVGDGKGGFTETAGSPFDLGHAAWHLAVADVNRDGKSDVLAAAGEGLRVMLGDGRGGFTPAPGSPFATGKGAWQLAAGDVNADGKPDVVTSSLDSETVTVLLSR
ncbi:MAG TPA: VCBS repeat-containing protein [Candidatus Polarisedimenticolia bacterium]|nr:VCBS repeat-containing protein [Candidatus Polarisedimenticolia bacterium]